MNLKKLFNSKEGKYFIIAVLLNLLLILVIYQSVFTLEFQGDGWQYAWGQKIMYENNIFSPYALQGMRTSLGGAQLTFALINEYFGLSAIAYYTISVILKFLTVLVFYFLINKLTKNHLASLIGSLLLSASFAGVEATHWVFNMYAYIGLIFIMLSILVGIDLPKDYKFKKWLASFGLACAGVWYATMRTNGIIPLIIAWSFYKFIILKSKSSKANLISWTLGFGFFIIIDKFLLGQMETDYSQKHIIGAGLRAFQSQIANLKYDFIFSPAANLGSTILPDVTWYSLNFPKIFSFFGGGKFSSVILPSFLIFTFMAWFLSKVIDQGKKLRGGITPKFVLVFAAGLYLTGFIYFILLLGPLNFSSWVGLVLALFGGYFMVFCLFLVMTKDIPDNLKNLFLVTFIWSFVFLLVPEFQNGGPILGTPQRYLVTTAPAVPMFMAGLITLSSILKNNLFRNLIIIIAFLMIFSHGFQTKAFFDRKAQVHNRQVSTKIWQEFKQIVPNKPEYKETPPTLLFISADNPKDQETLFESLYFGFIYRISLDYSWQLSKIASLYHQDYKSLVSDVKKNPKLLDEFYAVRLDNQSLMDITKIVKQQIAVDIKNLP